MPKNAMVGGMLTPPSVPWFHSYDQLKYAMANGQNPHLLGIFT